jgi:hypothetical protein
MNTRAMLKSAAVLAFASLLSAGSAQACMFGMPFQSNSASCGAGQAKPESCPSQGAQGQRSACPVGRDEMLQAMGSMAVGGMEMAATVMRALASEVDRRIDPNPGI